MQPGAVWHFQRLAANKVQLTAPIYLVGAARVLMQQRRGDAAQQRAMHHDVHDAQRCTTRNVPKAECKACNLRHATCTALCVQLQQVCSQAAPCSCMHLWEGVE